MRSRRGLLQATQALAAGPVPRRPGPPFRASEPPQNKVKFARDPAKFRHTLLTASLNGGLEPKSQCRREQRGNDTNKIMTLSHSAVFCQPAPLFSI